MGQSVPKYDRRRQEERDERETGAFLELYILVMILGTLAAIVIPNLNRLFGG